MAAKKKSLKKEKKVIVFDENSRREYLLGFQKRKNERRKKAKEDSLKREKDRRKELKMEKKKAMLDQIEKQRKVLEALESDSESDKEAVEQYVNETYDHPEHVVTVTTINDINLNSDKFPCIGPNRGLPETVRPVVPNGLPSQDEHEKTKTDKMPSKKNTFHKKFKRKRTTGQDGKAGKRRKRKNIQHHGKSKHFKKS